MVSSNYSVILKIAPAIAISNAIVSLCSCIDAFVTCITKTSNDIIAKDGREWLIFE